MAQQLSQTLLARVRLGLDRESGLIHTRKEGRATGTTLSALAGLPDLFRLLTGPAFEARPITSTATNRSPCEHSG